MAVSDDIPAETDFSSSMTLTPESAASRSKQSNSAQLKLGVSEIQVGGLDSTARFTLVVKNG